MKKVMTIIMAAGMCILNACAANGSDKSSDATDDTSVLVAYFSAQGHTRTLAEKVANITKGELFEIVPEQPYAKAVQPKELVVVPDAGHVDLYDRTDLIPFDKLISFFNANLID